MRRFFTNGLALGVTIVLAGCPNGEDSVKSGAGKTDAATTKATQKTKAPAKTPEKAATGPLTDHVSVGQRYTFETIIDNPRMTVKSVEVQTITHVTPDEILFDVQTTSNTTMKKPVPGMPPIKPTVYERKGNYPLKPSQAVESEKKSPEQTPVGKDTIEIDGVKFECDIYLIKGSRTWVDPRRFPGSVKSETKAMKRILTKIE